jgi:hypothetical protein
VREKERERDCSAIEPLTSAFEKNAPLYLPHAGNIFISSFFSFVNFSALSMNISHIIDVPKTTTTTASERSSKRSRT